MNIYNRVFITMSLWTYYGYIWGKSKDLQRQGQVNHVFCLGAVVCIKLFENGGPIRLDHMNDIPESQSESTTEQTFVNMVICL